jgi:16S rRNA (guanine527-N7)-methyltransferase
VEALLRAGIASLGLTLSETQVGQLLGYSGLLQKWARVYNLTAIRTPEEIVTHHLLDCLAVITPLRRMSTPLPQRILDVGSGAGLPGVVLAIGCPDIMVHCVDTVAKKTAFIQQAAGALALPNLRGIHSRVEQLTDHYPLATSRAFASLSDFVESSGAALANGGMWMAMKGKFPAEEVAAIPLDVEMFHVEKLFVPGLGAERCLVWMRHRTA